MSITTVLPMPAELSRSRLMEDVMSCLRRQPNVPLSLGFVADCLAGVSLAQVEQAVRSLEGPTSSQSQDAYVHYCRINCQAVYIT